MGVFVGRFGTIDGLEVFRITGTKTDCETIVQEAIDLGVDFASEPIINNVHNGQYTVKLEIKVPVGVSSNGECDSS